MNEKSKMKQNEMFDFDSKENYVIYAQVFFFWFSSTFLLFCLLLSSYYLLFWFIYSLS